LVCKGKERLEERERDYTALTSQVSWGRMALGVGRRAAMAFIYSL